MVLAVPQTVWNDLRIEPDIPPGYLIATGPAVKYLSEVDSRFWLRDAQAPTGMSERLGMTWEATDNQMGQAGIDLSVFAGGGLAELALQAPDRRVYFSNELDRIFPSYVAHSPDHHIFASWPTEPWTRCGYSCPGLGEVTTAAPKLAELHEERLAFAGEHTIMSMFGYMEGALQSGYRAAKQIKKAAGITEPSS